MPSRVLLVSPNRCVTPDPVFPLGLAHINAALRAAGHETRWLDVLVNSETLEQALAEFQPHYVGVSLRNIDDVLILKKETYFDALARITETVRRIRPCPVILGGSGFSVMPERLLTASGADFGIHGEGESGLIALLAALEQGTDPTELKGLVFRRNGSIVANPPPPAPVTQLLAEADRPPAVVEHYLRTSGMLNLQTQRGCAHTCCYCTYPLIEGRGHRRRPPGLIAEEMAQLKARGVNYVFIVDSIFNSSPAHVTETCEAILRRGVNLKWGCFLRPAGLTADLMKLMARAGLAHAEFGSDSLCDSVLEAYGKRFNFDDVAQSSEFAKQAGVDACHFLICGGPGETEETLEVSFQNSLRLPNAIIMAVVGMRIYPGTALQRRALNESVITPETDLLPPVYYLAPGLTEDGVFARLRDFAKRSASWIPGDPGPSYASLVQRLRRRGVAGPLWSYFAMLQRIMPPAPATSAA